MPIHLRSDTNGVYFQWGDHGAHYYFDLKLKANEVTSTIYNKDAENDLTDKISKDSQGWFYWISGFSPFKLTGNDQNYGYDKAVRQAQAAYAHGYRHK